MQAKQNRNKFNKIIIFKILPLWSSFLGLHVNYYFYGNLFCGLWNRKKLQKCPTVTACLRAELEYSIFFKALSWNEVCPALGVLWSPTITCICKIKKLASRNAINYNVSSNCTYHYQHHLSLVCFLLQLRCWY